MKIETKYVYPPIPIRRFDWSAIDADTYDGEGPISHERRTRDNPCQIRYYVRGKVGAELNKGQHLTTAKQFGG